MTTKTNWVEYTLYTRGCKEVNYIYAHDDDLDEMPENENTASQEYCDALGEYILETKESWARHCESIHMDFKFHVIPPKEILESYLSHIAIQQIRLDTEKSRVEIFMKTHYSE